MSAAELKISWILVSHSICHIGSSFAEIAYLPLAYIFDEPSSKENIIMNLVCLFSPVSYLWITIPLTLEGIKAVTSKVKGKVQSIIRTISSVFT